MYSVKSGRPYENYWIFSTPTYEPVHGTSKYVRIGITSRVFAFLVSLGWTTILWYLIITKSMSDGSEVTIQFFTNWTWVINLLFYTGDLTSYLDRSGVIYFYLTTAVFPILHASNWLVFSLVFIILENNPDVMLREARHFPIGLVFVGERIYHVLPTVVMLLYFDPVKIYGIRWPLAATGVFGVVVLLLFNAFLVYFFHENTLYTTTFKEGKLKRSYSHYNRLPDLTQQ
jgi:hypothetical protein